jgi:hypothetical protein
VLLSETFGDSRRGSRMERQCFTRRALPGAYLGRGDLWSLDFGLVWLAGLLERSSLLNSASTRSRQRTTLRTAPDSRADSGRTTWA